MTNNAPDYKENLFFAPKSQDDLNGQGRQSDVLIKALERCEKLKEERNTVIKLLLKKCPEYGEWVKVNFPEFE